MDKFFQELRKIQKKERGNSSLAKVDNNFYSLIYSYINDLIDNVSDDPFSNVNYLLKDTQRIATEICERREHKIAEAALMNIHRSYHLFKGKPEFDLLDTTPLNLTDEEEKLYYSLIDAFKNHRNNISLDSFNKSSKKEESTTVFNPDTSSKSTHQDIDNSDDEVLNRLNEISKGKVLENEKRESIEKQIINSKIERAKKNNINNASFQTNKSSNEKELVNSPRVVTNQDSSNVDELENLQESIDNQFVDLKEEDFLDSKIKNKHLVDKTLVLVFKDFNQIIGVDEKIYGPFKSQDLVIMPKANANVIVRCRKGRIIEI
ncbi:hypothetical protein [uncultured Methanobrevibacter sp.]|uniref:DNA replication complex subunit Gins51 n=1 Tax=uncultured Methanobrevibacter sp. TaxID=253161 RepID=UPI00258D3A2F|nr:hypothetical protein [uncultured Methanobrevibacter sp.]